MKRTAGRPEPIPPQEIAGSYLPILRGYLVAAAAYYLLISLSHPFYEKGMTLVVLEALAVVAAAAGFWLWRWLKVRPPEMRVMEAAALAMNALFMANVMAYQTFHLEPAKLVYFVLMAVVFATSAPTRRVA